MINRLDYKGKMSRDNAFRSMGAEVMRMNYVGEDIVSCAKAFASSAEFAAINNLIAYEQTNGDSLQILEIGAGNGIAAWSFAQKGFRVVALEPDPSPMLGWPAIKKLADATNTKILVYNSVSEKLPLSDETCSVVFCRSVLHHVSDLNKTLAEVFRVLQPGGCFIIAREHILSKPDDLAIALQSHYMYQLTGEMQNMRTLSEYKNVFVQAGFRIERVLDFLESEINYYPMTRRERDETLTYYIQARLARLIGNRIASITSRRMITNKFSRYFCLRWHALVDDRPGRQNTFLLRKPII